MTVVANQINTQEDKNEEVSQKVEAIIEARFSGEENTDLMKKQILDILGGDKQKALFLLSKDRGIFQYLPEKLQRDMDVIQMGVKKDPKIYKTLDTKIRQDIEIQKITIEAIISSQGNIFDIIEVLDSTKKTQKKLQVFTDAIMGDNKNFFLDEASRLFYEIYKSEKKLYKLITESGLLSESHVGISLGSGVAKHLSKNISDLEGESVEESQNKMFLALCKFLSLDEKSLGTTGNKLLRILISQNNIILFRLRQELIFISESECRRGRTLSFLNSIGKNIGVPEQSYEDSDGNKKVGSFKSLGAAIMHLKEVRDSGKIGELNIDVSKKGDKSIVEIYMKYIGLIAGPYDELSIANWKK